MNTVPDGAMKSVNLCDFYDNVMHDIIIDRPSNLFFPDAWTKTFARGFKNVVEHTPYFTTNTILEVGIGIGINMAGLMCIPCPVARFTGTNISGDAIMHRYR
jgi:hypothetical protein